MLKDTLWKLQPATAAKHRLYKRYLDAWWPKLLQSSRQGGRRRERVTYLDAFAGPGRYAGGEPGSPVFALDRLLNHDAAERMQFSQDRVRLLFMEKRPDRLDYLRGELDRRFGSLGRLPVYVRPVPGEAGTDSEKLLTETGAWGHPILAVFDSWGNVNVPFRLIERLARNPSSEVIVTFGPNWFSRRDKLDPGQLDVVFGGPQFWKPADSEMQPGERWRVWLRTYREALRRAGFRYQLQFRIKPGSGHDLYLVYGTGHPSGVESMKDAMWEVDGNEGASFVDPRTRGAPLPGQGVLWGGTDHPELLELTRQRLETGPVTLQELRTWLLTETSRWREKDAKPAVEELIASGNVVLSPAGRLTKNSVIRLR